VEEGVHSVCIVFGEQDSAFPAFFPLFLESSLEEGRCVCKVRPMH